MAELKLGKRDPKNAPSLALGPLLSGIVPAHPAATDYLAKLPGWQMLGNDQYGDCVAVTWANVRRLVTAALTGKEKYPSMADVLAVYKTQNPAFPSEDNGMDIQTLLEYLSKTGGPDGVKAVAFAKVDTSNLEEVKAALAIFGFVWTGVQVQSKNMDDFSAGRPWDYRASDSVEGGHSIVSGGYSTPTPTNDVRFVTWAKETGFTDRFWTHLADEAWVVIWPEHFGSQAFLQGIDQSVLASAYLAITGRVLPVPAPVPTPTPVPPVVETVTAADRTLASAVKSWASASHSGTNATAAKAVKVWLAAKGL
jgi:hypothetical protein